MIYQQAFEIPVHVTDYRTIWHTNCCVSQSRTCWKEAPNDKLFSGTYFTTKALLHPDPSMRELEIERWLSTIMSWGTTAAIAIFLSSRLYDTQRLRTLIWTSDREPQKVFPAFPTKLLRGIELLRLVTAFRRKKLYENKPRRVKSVW